MLVMLQHCAGAFHTNIFTPFGGTGVAMFLLLSGYGLNESYKRKGLDGFWMKKATRVFIPWFLFCLVLTFLESPFKWECFTDYVLCVKHYWYVKYLLFCYVVFGLSNKFFRRCRWMVLSAFAIYSFFCMEALQAEQSLSFMLGIIASEKKQQIECLSKKADVSLCMIFLFAGIVFLGVKQMPLIREQFDMPIYFAVQVGLKLSLAVGIMLLLWLIPHKFSKNRLFVLWGTMSFELYLVHIALLIGGMVGDSCLQALAMITIASFISYSFFTFNGNIKKYTL